MTAAKLIIMMMVRHLIIFPIWSQSAIITPKIPVDVMIQMQSKLGNFPTLMNCPELQKAIVQTKLNYSNKHAIIKPDFLRRHASEQEACWGAHMLLYNNQDLYNEPMKKLQQIHGITPSLWGPHKLTFSNPTNSQTQDYRSDHRIFLSEISYDFPFSKRFKPSPQSFDSNHYQNNSATLNINVDKISEPIIPKVNSNISFSSNPVSLQQRNECFHNDFTTISHLH